MHLGKGHIYKNAESRNAANMGPVMCYFLCIQKYTDLVNIPRRSCSKYYVGLAFCGYGAWDIIRFKKMGLCLPFFWSCIYSGRLKVNES